MFRLLVTAGAAPAPTQVSSKPRDGIMERLIAQDPMISRSSRGSDAHRNIARRSPAKSCASPRMIGIRREKPDRSRSMSPAPRPSAIAASNCEPTFARFQAVSRPRSRPLNGLGNGKSPPATAKAGGSRAPTADARISGKTLYPSPREAQWGPRLTQNG